MSAAAAFSSAADPSAPPSSTAARCAWSHAASSARRSAAPTSGVNRPWTITIPSSSTHVRSDRLSCRRRSSVCSAVRSTRRHPRTICSTCAAVPHSATSSSACSVSWRGHARDGAHLRVGDLSPPHGVAQLRQLRQRPRHPHVLAGRTGREPRAPAQPVGAGGPAGPAATGIELADQDEQVVGGGLDAGGELGYAVAEAFELCAAVLNGRDQRIERWNVVGGLDGR